MSFLNPRRMLVAATAAVALVAVAQAADISGAGATFPTPIYSKWADAYKKATGVGLNSRCREATLRFPGAAAGY